MESLIDRLRSATGPDRMLDAEIAKLVGAPHGPWEHVTIETRSISYVDEQAPAYTESLDAAMTLAEPGAEYEILTLYGPAAVTVGLNIGDHGEPYMVRRNDGNVILALCEAWIGFRAALLARGIERQDGKGR